MKKKFYKYGLFYIGVVLAACHALSDKEEYPDLLLPQAE